MPESDAKEAPKPPIKVALALPAVYQGSGSYTESSKGTRDVQFAMPGSRLKQVDVLQVDSTATSQPFVDPAVFQKWISKS
ncbi:hypothetical protein CORC01_11200 [Colletotrichum orchidophilum]|uniref:Uncharacterized protein n=1 Tax=Colletotrichum orchidophilum TaxID=1209926 RepID=A0A1G4AWK0_9PEZI|nr:uncharacterized protein CORC01_11200 [Colletotrichum orchidophilum]OHE93514.1 hypothetical protein CORC01_11200 [Colletotrichum orchidophilum]